MSYNKTTIKKMIADIDQKKTYLPALQRKFVWNTDQIELLFDSLMRNYPFGTFLFWRLAKKSAESYVFYEFLTDYDERTPYNRRKTGAFTHPEVIGVLDGQQRLSSMYIGLMGSHTEKTPHLRRANPNAYEKKYLYLNLLSLPYVVNAEGKIETSEDQKFEFHFRTEENVATNFTRKVVHKDGTASRNEAMFWMKVSQALVWDDEPEFDELIKGFLLECQTEEQKTAIKLNERFIKRALDTLHKRVQSDQLINYFEVAKDDLEDILKIFVRVNSGGTVLSKTDLLFSTIVATWDDGREKIETLLKAINEKGDKFNFGNEYLMRCCLVLTDGPVLYKVNSFKTENVLKIQNEWTKIAQAIDKTVDLLVEFGFNGSVLSSQNATIIIAYYLYKGGDTSDESKQGMKKYLVHALLNQVYGTAQEQLINTFRNAFRREVRNTNGVTTYEGLNQVFSFENLLKIELPSQKSLGVTDTDISRFLRATKGPSSFLVLTLLYPHLRYNEIAFHQDHMHPAAGFSDENFRKMEIPEEQWKEWRDRRDTVPNLQLMEGKQNSSKNATAFVDWFQAKTESEQEAFAKYNFFLAKSDLSFKSFMSFYDTREKDLGDQLRKVLAITNTVTVSPTDPVESRIEEEDAN